MWKKFKAWWNEPKRVYCRGLVTIQCWGFLGGFLTAGMIYAILSIIPGGRETALRVLLVLLGAGL